MLGSMVPQRAIAADGITVYSRLDFVPAVATAFTRKTRIAVRVRRPPPVGLLSRIVAEGDHPRWTIAWFYGTGAAIGLDQRGLLDRHLSDAAGHNGAFIPTGVGVAGVLVMARTAPFTPPTRWSALLAPAYHGLIGMNDPQTSEQGFAPIAAMVRAAGGWPQAQGYFSQLKQDGLHIYGNTATTLAALRSGSIQIAIVRSSAALHAATIDTSLRVVVPHPITTETTVLVVAKGNTPAAKDASNQFIAFARSAVGLAIAMRHGGADGNFWPVGSDQSAPPSVQALATASPLDTGPAAPADDRASIIRWFAATIVGPST